MSPEILLAYFEKLTFKRYQDLLRVLSSLQDIWTAPATVFQRVGWKDDLITEFFTWRKNLDETKIANDLETNNITCITLNDKSFPRRLKEISDPPLCLFIRGTLKETLSIAVVGPRQCSAYGQEVVFKLVPPLALSGLAIVSGMAYGIDGMAHAATLSVGGYTIAVLGSGVDDASIQPTTHRELALQIIDCGGAVISQYPPGIAATAYSFPKRNRIIAGLSVGTLIIEAGESSGSLITANLALDYNREVFAVPQNITSPTSIGVNRLIQKGAQVVTEAQDILTALNIEQTKIIQKSIEFSPETPTEIALWPLLSNEPNHIDLLIKHSGFSSREVNSTLTFLEIKGYVKNLGGMMYI